ncbi:MAG TPA: dicarboxylate/amino acid:cation symporter, partial [Saprospiraceae bacterium]|nr:dicarboxylate/amino acid:cation symporter [Saprospiraceae bacterium]
MKKMALHWQILLGIVAGILLGILLPLFPGWHMGDLLSIPEGRILVLDWIKPFGTIFINLLKLIAIPLIITSLITGIAQLKDISKFSRIGIRTIGFYLFTTLVATSLGLLMVNLVRPSKTLSAATKEELLQVYSTDASGKIEVALKTKDSGPLQPLIDIVPDNIFGALGENGNMLQVIFFVIFLGIGLILVKEEDARPVISFFHGLNEVIMKLVDLIMLSAPYGVLALMASLVVEAPNMEIFNALIMYSITVILGLLLLIFGFYPLLVTRLTKRSYRSFFKGMAPAQLLAFSTSSSAATLPVTMERVQEHLGVDEEVASFVLPIG